jgi:hypothetical protein
MPKKHQTIMLCKGMNIFHAYWLVNVLFSHCEREKNGWVLKFGKSKQSL